MAAPLLVLIFLLALCVPAQAAPVTLGPPLISAASTSPSGVTATLLNLTIAEPNAHATSPVNGVIVRWHLLGAEGGPLRLRVLRPIGGDAYTGVGTTTAATAATPGLEGFATQVPIQVGDTIGLDVVKGVKVGVIINPASVIAAFDPIVVEGTSQPFTVSAPGIEFAYSAEVQPAPTVTALSPKSGSFKGGTSVKITGTDFTSVSAVKFGSVPAKRYTVKSETVITAIAPAQPKPAKAGVTVTTIAGTNAASAAATFKGAACKVPKLKGKTLKAAKKRLRKADCKLGKLTKDPGVTNKTGHVRKQGKPAGKLLAPGTKIKLTLG